MMYDQNTRQFVQNEPIERHNLSLVSHDIPGNAPNKFRKDDYGYSREASEMYPHAALQRPASTLRDNFVSRYIVDERTGESRANASPYILKSAQQIVSGTTQQYRPQSNTNPSQARMADQYEDSRQISSTLRHYDKDVTMTGQGSQGGSQANPHEKPYQDKYREIVGRDYWSPNSQASQTQGQQQQGLSPESNGNYRQKYVPGNYQKDGQEFNHTQPPQQAQGQPQQRYQGQNANQNQYEPSEASFPESGPVQNPYRSGQQQSGQYSARGQQGLQAQQYQSNTKLSKYEYSDYKSPPVMSEYKESFHDLMGSTRRNLSSATLGQSSVLKENSKLFPIQDLDFVKNKRHFEIFNDPSGMTADVLSNPRFYVTESKDHKYHVYDLMDLEKKAQRAGISSARNPSFVSSAQQA